MTSNRRLHRLAAFTAASVLFAITSTVSALASSGVASGDDAPPARPAAAAVAAALTAVDAEPSDSSVAKVLRPAPVPTPAAAPAKAVAVVVKPAAPKPAAKAAPKPAAKASAKATTRTTTTRTSAAKVVTPRTITISRYVDAPGSQKAIDACNLVLWTHAPLWLAAHNYCGFQWLSSVPTGTIVRVTKGAAAGTFVVTGHLRLYRQSGALPAVKADLVLQTCVGSSTGLTLLRRV